MTSRTLSVLLLVVVSTTAHGQFLRGWGVKGGVAAASQSFGYASGYGLPGLPRATRWGVEGGLFVEFVNIPHVSFDLEALYVQKGRTVSSEEVVHSAAEPGTMSAGPVGATPRLDYMSIAFLVKGRLGGRGVVPFFAIGPRIDFLLHKTTSGGGVFQEYRKTDIGAAVGAGVEIVRRRSPLLSLEARWSPSLSKAYTNSIVSVKNTTIDLLIALWL